MRSRPGWSGTAGWLAERFTEQLGPVALTLDSDFFELGGSSLAAAKLTRRCATGSRPSRSPTSTTTARWRDLAARLDALGAAARTAAVEPPPLRPALGRDQARRGVRAAGARGAAVAARDPGVQSPGGGGLGPAGRMAVADRRLAGVRQRAGSGADRARRASAAARSVAAGTLPPTLLADCPRLVRRTPERGLSPAGARRNAVGAALRADHGPSGR